MRSLDDRHFDFLAEQRGVLSRIEACINNSGDLNEWEDSFLESIQNRVMGGKTLTSAQEDKLQQIEYVIEFGRESYWEEFGEESS